VSGGSGVNMVPDTATIGVDIRTVGAWTMAGCSSACARRSQGRRDEVFLPWPVWTPEQEWVERVFDICSRHSGARLKRARRRTDGCGNLLKV